MRLRHCENTTVDLVEAAGAEPDRTLLDSVSYCKHSPATTAEPAPNSCWRYVLSTRNLVTFVIHPSHHVAAFPASRRSAETTGDSPRVPRPSAGNGRRRRCNDPRRLAPPRNHRLRRNGRGSHGSDSIRFSTRIPLRYPAVYLRSVLAKGRAVRNGCGQAWEMRTARGLRPFPESLPTAASP
jgi:hypothetical protein